MRKISYRELQRMPSKGLKEAMPFGITVDSQCIGVILALEQYNRLVGAYKKVDSQANGQETDNKLHPFSKEEQVSVKMSKVGKQATLGKLKVKYDYRSNRPAPKPKG